MKKRLSNLSDKIHAPTPPKWRRIAGTIAAVAGALMFAPLSVTALSVIGVVGGVAAIIASAKTISVDAAKEMATEELLKIQLRLMSRDSALGLTEKEYETLFIVRTELENRGSHV